MRKELCQFNNVSLLYSQGGILENISFIIFRGERIALLGTRESGISLVAKILGMQIEKIDGVAWFSEELGIKKSCHPRYYYISSHSTLMPDLTVTENIYIVPWINSSFMWFSKKKAERDVAYYFEYYGISINHKCKVRDLGEYEKICVHIMKAVINNIEILVFDEVINNLTVYERNKLNELLTKFPRITIVYCALSSENVLSGTDRVFIISDGSLIQIVEKKDYSSKEIEAAVFGLKPEYKLRNKNFAKDSLIATIELQFAYNHCEIPLHKGESIGLIDKNNVVKLDCWITGSNKNSVRIRSGENNICTFREATRSGYGMITSLAIQKGIIPSFDKYVNVAFQAEMKFGPFRITDSAVDKYIYEEYGNGLPEFTKGLTYFDRVRIAIKKWEAANPKCLIIEEIFGGLQLPQRQWLADSIVRMANRGTAVVCIIDFQDEYFSKWAGFFDTIYSIPVRL